jgi:hypothetical protein
MVANIASLQGRGCYPEYLCIICLVDRRNHERGSSLASTARETIGWEPGARGNFGMLAFTKAGFSSPESFRLSYACAAMHLQHRAARPGSLTRMFPVGTGFATSLLVTTLSNGD